MLDEEDEASSCDLDPESRDSDFIAICGIWSLEDVVPFVVAPRRQLPELSTFKDEDEINV